MHAKIIALLLSRETFSWPFLSFTGKWAGCPAFLPVGRGEEGGNGLPQWSKSRPCNHNYISRKLRPVGGKLHVCSAWIAA